MSPEENTLETALAYLRQAPLQHLVHLKYLHLYPTQMTCAVSRCQQSTGVLLSHSPDLTPWDAVHYAFAQVILLPTASDAAAAERLAQMVRQQFPAGSAFVCKFCDPYTRAVWTARFPLIPTRTLISLTAAPDTVLAPDPEVCVSETVPEHLLPFFQENHYSREELDRYATHGGLLTFALAVDGEPVCACIAYRNFEQVWEIAALRTVAHARRRGYARRVVLTALSELLRQGRIPRYQAEATNTASIGLAQSLGMQVCLQFEHFRTA